VTDNRLIDKAFVYVSDWQLLAPYKSAGSILGLLATYHRHSSGYCVSLYYKQASYGKADVLTLSRMGRVGKADDSCDLPQPWQNFHTLYPVPHELSETCNRNLD
jgi:hypothetical protein